MTDPTPSTDALGGITHEEAQTSALRFINAHFRNPPDGSLERERPVASIPANADRDTDLRLMAYLRAVPAIVAHARELESERDRAVRFAKDRDGRLADAGRGNERLSAEVHRLRAELTRLRDDIQADQHAQDTLRVRLASTETERDRLSAELVGLQKAGARVAWDPGDDSDPDHNRMEFERALTSSSAALGARVIEEAERRGAEKLGAAVIAWVKPGDGGCHFIPALPPDVQAALVDGAGATQRRHAAAIEAAREEGRAEERKLIAAAVTDWAHSSGLRARPLLTVIEELESYRVRLEKSIRVATAAQDDAVDALATVTAERDEARKEAERERQYRVQQTTAWADERAAMKAERDEARRERDEAVLAADAGLREFAADVLRACGLTIDGGAKVPVHEVAALRTERDAALAKLAEVSESAKAYMEARLGGDTPDMSPFIDRLDDALSRAPSTALAERDARVRKTALEEAAEKWQERARQRPVGEFHGIATWLRSLASRGGGA